MKPHYHISVEQGALIFLYWLVFYNLWRLAAAFLAKRSGFIGTMGAAMGGLTHSAAA